MGRLCFCRSLFVVLASSVFVLLPACGGHKPPGASPFPVRITLTPSVSFSMQEGSTLQLTASAANGAGTVISPAFTYESSNTGVVDVAPNGAVCAGSWNAPLYSICTPAAIGTANVTASALGVTSPPTLIFVHPAIENITVSVVPPLNTTPPACPSQALLPAACDLAFTAASSPPKGCISQNQVVTLQATAFGFDGTDITGSVGPFSWTEISPTVTKITPIVTSSFNVATNQATASPGAPGQTQVVASASGVSSQPFYFETCPVQCIALELSVNGTQVSTATNFVVTKGTSETITATAVDVQGCIVPKPPLTWVSSSPAALSAGGSTGCTGTPCTISTTQVGAAAITASCSPPTCNIGWPFNPEGFPAGSIFIPQPVYPVTAITGLVTPATGASSGGSSGSGSSGSGSSGSGSSGSGSSGSGSTSSSSSSSSATSVLVSSQDCASDAQCSVALYNVSTTTNVPGASSELPAPPNSLMFDPAGDRAFMGSQFGAAVISPASLGSTTNPFTTLAAPSTERGVVTGKVIGVSPTGSMAIFSDTLATPNQVYVASVTTSTTSTGTGSSASSSTTTTSSTVALNINNATAATFSPDGLKAFILANGGNTLYIYSNLQALSAPQTLAAPASSMVFNSTGTFGLLSGGAAPGNLVIYNTCDSSTVSLAIPATAIPSPPQFLKMVPAGNVSMSNVANSLIPNLDTTGLDFFFGIDNTGIDIIATNSSMPTPVTTLCPQPVTLAHTPAPANVPFPPFHINIGQGTFNPIAFFMSPDSSQAYIVASDLSSVLIYNFNTRATSGISLVNNATPIAADMSADGTLIYIAGTDGLLHELNTNLGIDQNQISFQPLPNSTNNFCYTGTNCQMNLVAVRP